jgi:hypothetical protein
MKGGGGGGAVDGGAGYVCPHHSSASVDTRSNISCTGPQAAAAVLARIQGAEPCGCARIGWLVQMHVMVCWVALVLSNEWHR